MITGGLKTLVPVLSFIVLVQAFYIIDHLPSNKIDDPYLVPEVLLTEIEDKSVIEGQNFSLSTQDKQAKLFYDLKPQPDGATVASIFLETSHPVQQLHLRLRFNPSEITIRDSVEEEPGLQISPGDFSPYSLNEVDAEFGLIEVLYELNEPLVGVHEVAKIEVEKRTPQGVSILEYEYLDGSLQGSSATSSDSKENILESPSPIVF